MAKFPVLSTNISIKIAVGLVLVSLCSCSAFKTLMGGSGTEIKINDIPDGVSNLTSGKILTFFEQKPISSNELRVKLTKSDQDKPQNSTVIIVAKFGDEIRLIDFFVPGVNDKPELSFESTARSLVFMNPLFSGLSIEKRSVLFNSISKDKEFNRLVKLVSKSNSFLDAELIDLSSEIALRISQENFLRNPVNRNQLKNQSIINTSPNPSDSFESQVFPKASCGDPIPNDPKSYPVDFYPVFVDFSEENLRTIHSKFCQDSYQMNRQDNGKKSIQVASFTSLERANAFKEFLLKVVGSGEVGKPRRLESKETSSLDSIFKNLLAYIIPSAIAQPELKKLEYSIISQFDNDGVVNGYPLWHGVELQSFDNGIKISGTSVLAQQVIVLPTGKLKNPITKQNFIGMKDLDSNIVSENLIEPVELGIYDLNALKSATGGNRKDITLEPESGGQWKPGQYDVFLSAGYLLNRNKKTKVGAFDLNIGLLAGDIFSLAAGSTDKKPIDIALNLGTVSQDCQNELSLKAKDATSSVTVLMSCLSKPDNVVRISEAFGLPGSEEVNQGLVMKLLQFDGLAWQAVGKRLAKSINIADKVVATSRIGILGQYINHENSQGVGSIYLYQGSFTVVDPTQTPQSGGIGMSIQQYGKYLKSLPLGFEEDKISFSGVFGSYPGGIPNFTRPSYYAYTIQRELSDGISLRLSAAIESKDKRVVNRVELALSQKSSGYLDNKNATSLNQCPVTLDRLISVASSLKMFPGNAMQTRDDFVSVTTGAFKGTEIMQKEYRSGNTFWGISAFAGVPARVTGGPPIDSLITPCSYIMNVVQTNDSNSQKFCDAKGSDIQSYCTTSELYDKANSTQRQNKALDGL